MKVNEYQALECGTSPTLKKPISIRFSKQMMAHLELLSIRSDVPRNILIRQAVYQLLRENGVEDPHQF